METIPFPLLKFKGGWIISTYAQIKLQPGPQARYKKGSRLAKWQPTLHRATRTQMYSQGAMRTSGSGAAAREEAIDRRATVALTFHCCPARSVSRLRFITVPPCMSCVSFPPFYFQSTRIKHASARDSRCSPHSKFSFCLDSEFMQAADFWAAQNFQGENHTHAQVREPSRRLHSNALPIDCL